MLLKHSIASSKAQNCEFKIYLHCIAFCLMIYARMEYDMHVCYKLIVFIDLPIIFSDRSDIIYAHWDWSIYGKVLTQCIAVHLWSHKNSGALLLHSRKPDNLCVSIRTACIPLEKLNVILPFSWKIRSNFHNKDTS